MSSFDSTSAKEKRSCEFYLRQKVLYEKRNIRALAIPEKVTSHISDDSVIQMLKNGRGTRLGENGRRKKKARRTEATGFLKKYTQTWRKRETAFFSLIPSRRGKGSREGEGMEGRHFDFPIPLVTVGGESGGERGQGWHFLFFCVRRDEGVREGLNFAFSMTFGHLA